MSYSEHFRRKVIAKLEEGYSIRAVSAQFEIDKNTILSWKNESRLKMHPRKFFKINDGALPINVKNTPMIINMSAL